MRGFDFGTAIIFKNNVGYIQSKTTNKLYFFRQEAVLLPLSPHREEYLNYWIFKKPVFCVDMQLFEYCNDAAINVIISSNFYDFDNKDYYDDNLLKAFSDFSSRAKAYFSNNSELKTTYKEELMKIYPDLFFTQDSTITDYYNYLLVHYDRNAEYNSKNLLKLFFRKYYNLFYPSFSSDSWLKMLELFREKSKDALYKYEERKAGYISGRHYRIIGKAKNYNMYKEMIINFKYKSRFTKQEVLTMIQKTEEAKITAIYTSCYYEKAFDYSLNTYGLDTLQEICLNWIKKRESIIANTALCPDEMCFLLFSKFGSFINNYETEALRVLTFCIKEKCNRIDTL